MPVLLVILLANKINLSLDQETHFDNKNQDGVKIAGYDIIGIMSME